MLALAFLLAVDTFVAFSLAAESALVFARRLLTPVAPYPLPPHEDPRGITRYSDKVLEPLRLEGDGWADPIVDAISELVLPEQSNTTPTANAPTANTVPAADPADAVRNFYQALLSVRTLAFDDKHAELLPYEDAIEPLLTPLPAVPPQLAGQLERAGEFFKKNFAKIMVILSTSALLEAFASVKGVKVLASTNYLSNNTNRRLYETLQFVLYVNEPDGFTPKGNAVRAILRVRLMHACIRWILTHNPARPWQPAWGVPINGEDLLGMQMGFSGLVIRDLAKLWVNITAQEADDHLVLWNVVGQLLGVPTALRADSLGEALALIDAVERRQHGPSDDGRLMTDALVAFHQERLKMLFPVGLYLMHRLAGEQVCRMLDVPWSPLAGAAVPDGLVDWALRHWGTYLVFGKPAEGRPEYDIPVSLNSVYQEFEADQGFQP